MAKTLCFVGVDGQAREEGVNEDKMAAGGKVVVAGLEAAKPLTSYTHHAPLTHGKHSPITPTNVKGKRNQSRERNTSCSSCWHSARKPSFQQMLS